MQKIQLHFILTGKSDSWARGLSKETLDQFNNEHKFNMVREAVVNQFGDRAVFFVGGSELKGSRTYPKYYSAGWFISCDDNEQYELVIVDHGKTMEDATNTMMESAKSIDWSKYAVKV